MNRPHVLVIEDEPVLRDVLADNLRHEDYRVDTCGDGLEALARWTETGPDLVVLDVMLPGLSGFEICERMRRTGDRTPVLFLSAKDQPEDRIRGLSAGGDDYLVKPFNLTEFLLRVHNMLKRRGWTPGETLGELDFAGHRVNFRTWEYVLADGSRGTLGEREHGILRLLVRREGEVVSRDMILDEVWG
ncbi:MAG TPA: response regulator transcription factor, partial [Deinococcales bacterium]|nr:response regulator transcription factor [Deinococcales bacterium]